MTGMAGWSSPEYAIADSRISAWIYGHSHHRTDIMIGNTHLVSNPLGYVFCGENTNFKDSAVIEV